MSQTRKVTYRNGLFDPVNLNSQENIENALLEFSCVLTSENYEQALSELCDQHLIVELILSGLNEEVPLRGWILQDFPVTAKLYEPSFFCKLMKKLSHFFLFHLPAEEKLPELVCNHHQTVQLASEILQALFAGAFLDDPATEADSQERSVSSKKSKAKGSQRETKLAKKAAARSNALNDKLFTALDLSVPRTRSDAEAIVTVLVERLRAILEFYLIRIRTPELNSTIQESFLVQDRPDLKVVTELLPIADDSPPPLAPATASETHAVYPLIQPLKSALYFDSPDGFGKWNVLVSQGADRNLRDYHKRSKKNFNIIVKKIKELSQGHFSRDNQKRLNGPIATEVPIFEAKMARDLRLVYQVDCISGYANKTTVQVLRLYGICTHAQMDSRMWERVGSHLSKRGKQYRERCLERVASPGAKGNVYIPAEHLSDIEVDVEECDPLRFPELPTDDANQLHKILTLEKYVTLSKELLESIEENREAAFPFETSKQEKAIIQYPASCYVLGRSGTGKTTTMLFKMLWIERAYQMDDKCMTRPRQVFVTKSGVLVSKVHNHFMKYLSTLASASHISKDARAVHTTSLTEDDENLCLDDEETKWRKDLPRRYSQLEDCHFPLFVMFDQLCAMLEADIEEAHRRRDLEDVISKHRRQPASSNIKKGKLVTFDRFLGEYWPHFNESTAKRFDPSLVFNEIMGVILGSEGTVTSARGHLDRQTYEKLSVRMQPTFAGHRSTLYDIFESYCTAKQELGDFDSSDRTHNIIRSLSKETMIGQIFDYLYVDEAQDNLLVDTLLLRMLCRNQNGLFWAGDTAQTISAGSSFRFNDLKAFLYRIEGENSMKSKQIRSRQEPPTFHLAVNYRSHAGIVNCAHTVIELISKYFPYTIDALSRERGTANGAKPVFYNNINRDFVREGRFLARKSDKKIELGADQCILVRDETAKQRLAKEIGKIGLIITLYDSKGLEFNDVLLYNFFHDSPIKASQWRVVLGGISEHFNLAQSMPGFDDIRHAALCSELKCLYVAITRARNNLRIADESLKGEPMRTLWASREQIHSCNPGDDLVDFAAPSSKEAWAHQGKELFNNHRYALARDCYEKAHRPHSAAIAQAYHLREVAERSPAHSNKSKENLRVTAFRQAATAFSSCASNSSDTQSKKGYLDKAAYCLEMAGDILAAAQEYRSAQNLTKAALLFRKLGKFEDVHGIIVDSPGMVELAVLESVQDVVRLYYVSKKEFGKAHQLFSSLDEEIEYLEDRNLDMAHLDLLLLHGRKIEAAELHLAEGRNLQAADIFLDMNENKDFCLKRAKESILEGLWKLLSFGTLLSPAQVDSVNELLSRVSDLDHHGILDANEQDEIEMFTIFVGGETSHLSRLAHSFLKSKNINAALLCLDCQFSCTPSFLKLNMSQMAQTLEEFSEYVHILYNLAYAVDPSTEPRVWKLFGISACQQDGTFGIPSGTFLHQCYERSRIFSNVTESDSHSHLMLSKDKLVEIFRNGLRSLLLDRVTRENDACRKAPALSLCLRNAVYRECDDPSLCGRSHISPDPVWYQLWIKTHLLQILIYHSIFPIQFGAEMQSQQRFWIRKLHEVIHPPHYALGSLYSLDHGTKKAVEVVLCWIRSLSSSLRFTPAFRFLTIAMQTADLAFMLDRKEAPTYIYRSSFAISPCPSQYLRGVERQNSLQELLMSFNYNDPSGLIKGILFIRHVMEESIDIDIDVYCRLIERICGLLVVCNRYRWHQSFHRVTLPHSWLKELLAHFDPATAPVQDAGRFWLLLQPLRDLLRAVYFSKTDSHLLYGEEYHSLGTQASKIRSLYIARICRALGLLGYNIGVENFRAQILDAFTSLQREDHRGFNKIYARFIYAQNFDDIARETRRSMMGSPLDQIVELLSSRQVQCPVHDIFGVRRVIYTTHADILPLLGDFPSPWTLNPMGPTTSSVETSFSSSVADENSDNLVERGQTDDKNEDLIFEEDFQNAGDENPNFIPETTIPEDVYVGHSILESKSASFIQKVYRKFLERRRMLQKSGLEASTYRWNARFNDKTAGWSMTQVPPRYKLRYLGPVPLLLAGLDAIETLVLTKKRELKGKLVRGNIHHEELDQVGFALNRANTIVKEIKQYRNALQPDADVHHRRDLPDLERRVRAALDLVFDLRLPMEVPESIIEGFRIVYKAVLQKKHIKKTPKKSKLPTLGHEEAEESLTYDDTWEEESIQ